MTKETKQKTNEVKPAVAPASLVLTADDIKDPNIQAWIKKKKEKEEAESRKKFTPAILKSAGDITGKTFETLKQLVNFLEPKQKEKRAKPLKDAEGKLVDELIKEGKAVSEVARTLKKKAPQIYRYLKQKGSNAK